MPGMVITLKNGSQFKSKKECQTYFSSILKKAKLNNKVSEKYHEDVLYLFERHPKFKKLYAAGIKFIYVGKDTYGYRCFYVKLVNEGVDSFSIKKCIDAEDDSNFTKFQQAARTAVIPQILAFKNSKELPGRKFISEKSGEVLKHKDAHVDHIYPFVNIVLDFIDTFAIDITNTKFNADIPMTMQFDDPNLAEEFAKYHKMYAKLRVISAKENMQRKRSNIKRNKYDRRN